MMMLIMIVAAVFMAFPAPSREFSNSIGTAAVRVKKRREFTAGQTDITALPGSPAIDIEIGIIQDKSRSEVTIFGKI